jgi:hypothetical protein
MDSSVQIRVLLTEVQSGRKIILNKSFNSFFDPTLNTSSAT